MQRIYLSLRLFLWSTGFIGAKYGLPYARAAVLPVRPLSGGDRADDGDRPAHPRPVAEGADAVGAYRVSGLLVHAVYLAACSSPSSRAAGRHHRAGRRHAAAAYRAGAGWLLGEASSPGSGSAWRSASSVSRAGRFRQVRRHGGARPDAGAGPVRPCSASLSARCTRSASSPASTCAPARSSSSCRRRWPPCR